MTPARTLRQRLPRPATNWALFLDVDGTMLDLASTPDSVVVDSELVSIIRRLCHVFGGAVALISGRNLAMLDRLFAPLRLPVAGLHGIERRDASGNVEFRPVPGPLLRAIHRRLAEFAAAAPGILVENKGGGVALHFRGAPDRAAAARVLVHDLVSAHAGQLHIVEGKMVLEIKPALADKGTAIASFMDEAPFRGRLPVFLGDDTTDEDGFAAVNRMGGHSICVGTSLLTGARWRIARPGLVRVWLAAIPAAARKAPR